ncbi:MAG: hypothetical protein BMS9Abin12_0564 [Acidimicrobiia bacterium]|nr:MAG: hypothetical protein BMS9Abin12_0564 [Acidimicrobiia bacterium]
MTDNGNVSEAAGRCIVDRRYDARRNFRERLMPSGRVGILDVGLEFSGVQNRYRFPSVSGPVRELPRFGQSDVDNRLDIVVSSDRCRRFESALDGGREDNIDPGGPEVFRCAMCLKHSGGGEMKARKVPVHNMVGIGDGTMAYEKEFAVALRVHRYQSCLFALLGRL